MECGCSAPPMVANGAVHAANTPPQGGILGALGVETPRSCVINHNRFGGSAVTGGAPAVPTTVFVGPDGNPQPLTDEQCARENVKAQVAAEEAYQRSAAGAQRVV